MRTLIIQNWRTILNGLPFHWMNLIIWHFEIFHVLRNDLFLDLRFSESKLRKMDQISCTTALIRGSLTDIKRLCKYTIFPRPLPPSVYQLSDTALLLSNISDVSITHCSNCSRYARRDSLWDTTTDKFLSSDVNWCWAVYSSPSLSSVEIESCHRSFISSCLISFTYILFRLSYTYMTLSNSHQNFLSIY